MNALYFLLLLIAITSAAPVQTPLLSGKQLDWTDAECFANADGHGNNTVCIQQVFSPVVDSAIFPSVIDNQFCGYMQITNGANPVKLFFWVVLSERDPTVDPVVLWTNGGPGSSSVAYGMFGQWGPYIVDKPQGPTTGVRFKRNPNYMTEKMTWVFLEHPTGTGYSKGSPIVEDSFAAARNVIQFIDKLFKNTKFKYKGKDLSLDGRDFHIAGESYAGHYLPAIGNILVMTKKAATYNLKSFLLGNGCMDESLMGQAIENLLCGTAPLALTSSPGKTPPAGTRQSRCSMMGSWRSLCASAITNCRTEPDDAKRRAYCNNVFKDCNDAEGFGWAKAFQTDPYDATRDMEYEDRDTAFYEGSFAKFMNDQARRTRFGVGKGRKWEASSDLPYQPFVTSGDFFRNFIPELQTILTAGIDFMIFAGDQDLACPETLTRLQALNTAWVEADPVFGSKYKKWRSCEALGELNYNHISLPGSGPYASYIKAGHLNYVRVFGAGHMINENKAPEAKDLFERWILNRSSFSECNAGPP
ncbi:alpha/beta-hydrolase [Zopfia rhizophila CBS 207.26]|uniref:Carboxypeptidase n=1 Tax=Zopfia rhizophila CBS 207.26 TaxID=1314779 RepID=A0A6A6DHF3_9PEZI|nr:alpha/beta-hydrolase [Zopfia rhizophila CBS 207.26]